MEASSQLQSSIYSDAPLPLGSIRLLKLHNWQRHLQPELIQVSLKEFALSQAPAFVALSYTWHDERSPLPITINRQRVEVRRNLREFFRQARWDRQLSKAAPYIWVDAICINQADNEEKARQVQMMGDIYKKAHAVLIWLGAHDNGSDEVFRCVRLATEAATKRGDEVKPEDLVAHWAFGTDRPIGQAFSFLCSKTYWARTWVLQECILARDILVCCGTSWLPWDALRAAIALVKRHETLIDGQSLSRLYLRWDAMVTIHGGNCNITKSLPLLMHYCEETRCSDIRDKIYSVLSLVNILPLSVDYAISPAQLCLRGIRSWASTHETPWEVADSIRRCLGLEWAQVLEESLQDDPQQAWNEESGIHLGVDVWEHATVFEIDSDFHPPGVGESLYAWIALKVVEGGMVGGFTRTKYLLVREAMDMSERTNIPFRRGDQIFWKNDVVFVFRRHWQGGKNLVGIGGGLLLKPCGERAETAEEMRKIEERVVAELAWKPDVLQGCIATESSYTSSKDLSHVWMQGRHAMISMSVASFIVFCAGSSIRRDLSWYFIDDLY